MIQLQDLKMIQPQELKVSLIVSTAKYVFFFSSFFNLGWVFFFGGFFSVGLFCYFFFFFKLQVSYDKM